MSSQKTTARYRWALAGAVLLLGACSGPEELAEGDSGESLESVQQELNSTDTAAVNKLKADMKYFAPKFKVKPVIECIDKISSTKFIAHFGYSNSDTTTRSIDIGGLNRFFPNPASRGQPTVFSRGTWKNQVQVPFNGQLLVWAVDGNVAIAHQWITTCPKPPVKCPVSCDDKNPCTADLCNASTGFRCIHRPQANGVSCADGNACNGEEICRDGACKAGKAPVCQDSNPCTANTCDPTQGCLVTPKRDGTSCGPVPGNCGAGGVCQTGVCQAKTPNCDDKNPCTADSCGPNNSCKHTPLAVGTACGDSNFCNGAEVCNAKAQCRAPTRPDCNDSNPCTIDSCLVAGGCGHVPGNDGKKCKTSTGSGGKCDSGVCQPTGVICADDGNPCTDEVIDPVTGACTHPPKVDDTVCNDNNLCTQRDVCKSGTCTGTLPVTCDGATACRSAGACNPSTGLCQSGTSKPNGTTCDDSSLCTTGDVCQSGQCKGVAVICTGDQCHDAGTCDPSTGICFNPNKANGTSCSDAVKCTSADVCTDGVCAGEAVVCQPQDGCHLAGVCAEATGLCSNPVAADGKDCTDGDACTQTDSCTAGVCRGSNPVTCPGATACRNAAACDGGSGLCLSATPKPDGTTCSDARNCTTADSCQAGECQGAPVVCTALDACHGAGTCDEASGLCSDPVAPDGTTCSDGRACTTSDSCTAGVCGGAAVVCPAPSDACHLQGTCDEASGACSSPVAPNGTACNDGNGCTRTDVCASGTCAGGNPVQCAAGDQCNNGGVCNPGTGACTGRTPKATGTTCDDGIRCTSGDSCTAGTCGGTPLTCGAGQTCSESTGTCGSLTACETCVQQHIVSGECPPQLGCANITTGASDTALCVAMRDCMLSTGCWSRDPMDCLCGDAVGTDCLVAPTGVCKAEVIAAVKTGDPAQAATLFYDFGVPSGYAAQQLGCMKDYCSPGSNPPSTSCPVATVCADDGNPCTDEVVVNGVCTHPPVTDGTSCSDDNACTQVDSCQAGACMPGPAVQCTGGSACVDAGTCDATSGLCVGAGPKPNGAACDDGKRCTTGDACSSGVCGGTPLACNEPASCNESDGTCQLDRCWTCKKDAVDNGLCVPETGCHLLTNPADKALCVALRDCMVNSHCATQDPFNCFCGQFQGTACLSNADGACKQQVLDATRAGTSLTDAGTRFYDPAFPAGYATQEIACAKDFCASFPANPATDACSL